jgi:hypothetical protein
MDVRFRKILKKIGFANLTDKKIKIIIQLLYFKEIKMLSCKKC